MKSVLLVTKQLRLAMNISSSGNKSGLFINNFTNVKNINDLLDNTSASGIIWDLSVLNNYDQTMKMLRDLRSQFNEPIIALAKNNDLAEEEEVFDADLDDYINQPFDSYDIIVRIRHRKKMYDRLKDAGNTEDVSNGHNIKKYKDFVIDLKHFQIQYQGVDLNLTPKEFYLFYYLIRHNNQVLSRERIFQGVWGDEDDSKYVSSRIVDMHVSHLRDKMNQFKHRTSNIKTIRGFGYLFD